MQINGMEVDIKYHYHILEQCSFDVPGVGRLVTLIMIHCVVRDIFVRVIISRLHEHTNKCL
jgi:hypothetical protein